MERYGSVAEALRDVVECSGT